MATALIRVFSAKFPLLALKISLHVNDSLGNTSLIEVAEGFRIFRDLGPHHKNSRKFLEAGARQSYFMETGDKRSQASQPYADLFSNGHHHFDAGYFWHVNILLRKADKGDWYP